MKTDIQTSRTPKTREDVMTNDDDFTERLRNLSLEQQSPQIKNNAIIKNETKNKKNVELKFENNIKVEPKDDEEEIKVPVTKFSPKKEDIKVNEKTKIKEEEKPKVKEEPLGELCPRGPDRKGLATQPRATAIPYSIAHPQRNPSLANGGHLIYTPDPPQQMPEICYPNSSICIASELPLESYTNHSPPVHNGHGHFINNITGYPLEVTECPDKFQQLALSPAKPEAHCDLDDNAAIEIIQNVVNDPIKHQMLCQNLQECLQETMNMPCEAQNILDTQINQSPYSSYGSLSPESSPQVVPRQSPYPVSYGSPLGPSSPNMYANTPTFSPNIPSPRGYMSDDSSTHMYPSSSPPMTNQSYLVSDPINLDAICGEPPIGKRLEEKKLMQELANTCSQACSTSEAVQPPLSCHNSNVPLAPPPVVITAIIPPSPTHRAKASGGSHQSTTKYRTILPKPIDDSKPSQQAETYQALSASPKKNVSCNGVGHSPRKCVLPAKEQFRLRCSPKLLDQTYAKVHAYPDDVIAKVDADGDTELMVMVCNKSLQEKPQQLYALVERCKELPQVLCARNKDGESALTMACLIQNKDPLVAKYIAETMTEVGANLDEPDKNGSSLIHVICKYGDSHADILQAVLSWVDQKGESYFNINKSDYEGRTPLHVAVQTHNLQHSGDETKTSSIEVVKTLLKYGADMGKKDLQQGSTPLHYAVATDKPDPKLVKVLLSATKENKDLVNIMNYKGDTPLHVALAFGGNIEKNTLNCILESLLVFGASRAIRNQNGKAPLELAPDSRKLEIKKILDKYSGK